MFIGRLLHASLFSNVFWVIVLLECVHCFVVCYPQPPGPVSEMDSPICVDMSLNMKQTSIFNCK